MTSSRQGLALTVAMVVGIQVGATTVATRYVADGVGPGALALMRYGIALLCLVPFVSMAARVRFPLRDLLAVMVLGVGQFGILMVLLNIGLQLIPAARAALLFATAPFLTMILATALGREPLTWPKAIGVLLSFAGVAATLGEEVLTGTGSDQWTGTLAVLLSALTAAICTVLYGPYVVRLPTLHVGALAMFAAVLFLSGFAAVEGLFIGLPRLDGPGWAAVGFIGISSGTVYLMWLWALKHTTPTRVTVFLSLSPITAAVLGVALLGEPLTPGTLIGVVAVAAGLWIATRGPGPASRPERRAEPATPPA